MSCPHGEWSDCPICMEIDCVWDRVAAAKTERVALAAQLATLTQERDEFAQQLADEIVASVKLKDRIAELTATLAMAVRYASRGEVMAPADLADVQALLKPVSP